MRPSCAVRDRFRGSLNYSKPRPPRRAAAARAEGQSIRNNEAPRPANAADAGTPLNRLKISPGYRPPDATAQCAAARVIDVTTSAVLGRWSAFLFFYSPRLPRHTGLTRAAPFRAPGRIGHCCLPRIDWDSCSLSNIMARRCNKG